MGRFVFDRERGLMLPGHAEPRHCRPLMMGAPQQMLMSYAADSTADPNFASVSLLLHCDGAPGSTTFTDSSSSPKTVTRNGALAISTSTPKYGSGSANFNSSPSSLDAPSQAFGTGDFTVEFWGLVNSFLSNSPTFCDNRVIAPTASFVIYNSVGGVGTIAFFAAGSNRAAGTMPTNTYAHLAVSRTSSVSKFFINGVQQGSDYADTNNYDHTTLRFGDNNASSGTLAGQMDEIRVTLGFGRYTSNFTPRGSAFPNF